MPQKTHIEDAMKKIIDPELHIDIWSLGLIYNITITGQKVHILMSLTSPICPYGPALIDEVRRNASAVEGVKEVEVEITFSPPWGPDRMSDEARIALGM